MLRGGRKKRDEDTILYILNSMANAVDFERHNFRQNLSEIYRNEKLMVEFERRGCALMYIFSGFGDLMGYYVRVKQDGLLICQSRIGIDGETTAYLPRRDEKYFRIFVSADSELSDLH